MTISHNHNHYIPIAIHGGKDPDPEDPKDPIDPKDPKDPVDPKEPKKPEDEVVPKSELAKVLKDMMKHKDARKKAEDSEKAKADELAKLSELLNGLKPDEVKAALEAQKTAEEERAKAAGEWEKLKERLVHSHKTEIGTVKAALDKEIADLKAQNDARTAQIRKLTVSNSFAASKFINEELILTPGKAEKLFGENFKVEEKEGQVSVVAYLGDEPIVDTEGKPLSFDAALREIVGRDDDKDSILRSKAKPGSGSGKSDDLKADPLKPTVRGLAAIKVGLDAKTKK